MEIPRLPTAEGKRRYPHSNGYLLPGPKYSGGGIPCICTMECPRGCDGRCGCEACGMSFTMYANEQGWLSPDGLVIDLDDALVIYGECWPPLPESPNN